MEATNKLPIPSFGDSSLPTEGMGALIEASSSVFKCVSNCINSTHNRDVRISQIVNKAAAIMNRDEKIYLDRCNMWATMREITTKMIDSGEFSSEQIIETIKGFREWINATRFAGLSNTSEQ